VRKGSAVPITLLNRRGYASDWKRSLKNREPGSRKALGFPHCAAASREVDMDSIEGFILTGGASSRMGSDKAQLTIGANSFVELIATALGAIAHRIRSVGKPAVAGSPLGLPNVPDIYPQWGALGGLHAALAACTTPWAAVVACDLPFVTGALFQRLATLRDDFDAVVPVQSDGRVQPLCALYRCQPCFPQTGKLIAAGERRPRALLTLVRTRWVPEAQLGDLDGAADFFANVNTPQDYMRARALAASPPAEN
jgi:molybdopterin-guanine dinucleotide biosynthesis protein A